LTRVGINTLTYASPDEANQLAGPIPYGASLGQTETYIDGGDTRVQALVYAGAHLYLTLATGINDVNGRWVVGSAYVVLTPTFRNNTLAAQVLQQGYCYVNSNHLLRPAISVNAQGAGAIAVTLVGSNYYPSAAMIPFQTGVTPTTLQIAATGALPEDGFTGYQNGYSRWGDYNTSITASDGSIWSVVEYIGNYPRTTAANWNTYVIHYQ
jgi:hypothetical protein